MSLYDMIEWDRYAHPGRSAEASRLADENSRLKAMLRECIAELRALDAHTVSLRAENLLRDLTRPQTDGSHGN